MNFGSQKTGMYFACGNRMIRLNTSILDEAQRGWHGGLELALDRRGGRNRVAQVKHWGPLRIQRPFYPQGPDGECHLYLLHPPGGMVTGDRLDIAMTLSSGAHGLLTTPSAGKLYRGNDSAVSQVQSVVARVQGDSFLEWLPQETIVFDGARGESNVRVELDGNARCAVWDMVCLGRPASGESFTRGYLRQGLALYRDGEPLYLERNDLGGGGELLNAPWGLDGCPVSGTFLLTLGLDRNRLGDLREELKARVLLLGGRVAVSDLGGLVAIRYLGKSAAHGRSLFICAWRRLRPMLAGVEAVEPRIWHT